MKYINLKSVKGAALAASFLYLLAFLPGCTGDDNQTGPSCLNEYNLSPVLEHYADNLILPRYSALQKQAEGMRTTGESFLVSPSVEGLKNFRETFVATYTAWQYAAPFDFGPSEEEFLPSSFNNFPLNKGKAIADAYEGNTNFSSPDDYNKGLPLLDYFLFGIASSDEAIVDSFLTNERLNNYTRAVLEDMSTTLSVVVKRWKDEYRDVFVQKTGTKDGESISLLVNALNKDYEFIKRNKIGVASGVLSLGFTNPEEIEGYHSQISKMLLEESVKSSLAAFQGKGVGGIDGEGSEEMLRSFDVERNGMHLADVIIEQYAKIINNISTIDGPLSTAVDEDKEDVIALYNMLSEQVIYLKSDLPSVMCIPITYVDNPSDSD
jgi:predicted lipoprotein